MVFGVAFIISGVVMGFHTGNFVRSISIFINMLFLGTKYLRILSGAMNPEFWSNKEITRTLCVLINEGADVKIWARNPRSTKSKRYRRDFRDVILPELQSTGLDQCVYLYGSAQDTPQFI